MRIKSKPVNRPLRAPQVPVTVQMMNEMEGRLIHRMDAGFHQLKSEMGSLGTALRSEMADLKSDVKSEIKDIRSDMLLMRSDWKSDLSKITSELHRVALLVEEQNARNKYVLDGYAQLYDMIDRRLNTENR